LKLDYKAFTAIKSMSYLFQTFSLLSKEGKCPKEAVGDRIGSPE